MINFKKIDASENRELAKKFRVMHAPTLIVINGDKVESYTDSNIKQYAEMA